MRPTSISVILPIYNKIEIVYDCILQNAKHASLRNSWIIIDNNSDEPTKKGLARLKTELTELGQDVQIITESENTGVARAWNRGLAASITEYCLILNNDCILQKDWDKLFIQSSEQRPGSIISAFIFEPGDSPLAPDLATFLTRQTILSKRNRDRFRPGLFVGITLFGARATFLKVDSFDEKYWLSMEETDFLFRAVRSGINIGISGDILGFHYSSVTRRSVSFDHNKNARIFLEKHGWDFSLWQAQFCNKMKRSWQKRIKSYLGRLSEVSESLPARLLASKNSARI